MDELYIGVSPILLGGSIPSPAEFPQRDRLANASPTQINRINAL
jgi:hypothetical protein